MDRAWVFLASGGADCTSPHLMVDVLRRLQAKEQTTTQVRVRRLRFAPSVEAEVLVDGTAVVLRETGDPGWWVAMREDNPGKMARFHVVRNVVCPPPPDPSVLTHWLTEWPTPDEAAAKDYRGFLARLGADEDAVLAQPPRRLFYVSSAAIVDAIQLVLSETKTASTQVEPTDRKASEDRKASSLASDSL